MPVFKDEQRNTYYVKCYYTDYTGTKKQKLKRGFKLQREAKEWERTFLEKMQGSPDMTFQALYELYIEDMSKRLRESTMEVKKNMFKNRILPYFKDKPINTITPADIRKWQNTMMDGNYSEYYLNRLQNALSTVFNYAIQYYSLPSNPCTKSGRLGHSTKSLNFWTVDQYKEVLSHVSDIRAYTALQLLFYSGMRCGELRALTLADINFTENTINISKTLHHTEEGYKEAPPKTASSVRNISMPATIMDEIKAYCDKIYGLTDSDRVFDLSSHFIRKTMTLAASKTNLQRIRIHDLRHSHVSLLIDMGFSPHLVAERIGDTVQMVNSTYGHLYPTKHKEVADKLNDLLVSN